MQGRNRNPQFEQWARDGGWVEIENNIYQHETIKHFIATRKKLYSHFNMEKERNKINPNRKPLPYIPKNRDILPIDTIKKSEQVIGTL